MSKNMLVVATTVVLILLGGCTSYNGGYASGSDSHAGHSH